MKKIVKTIRIYEYKIIFFEDEKIQERNIRTWRNYKEILRDYKNSSVYLIGDMKCKFTMDIDKFIEESELMMI